MIIDKFTGKYSFLSNFYASTVWLDGYSLRNVETAFQASKTFNWEERSTILNCGSPRMAKQLGQKVTLRPDWEQVKFYVMHNLVEHKFFYDAGLAADLIKTGDAQLVEGNTWGDTYWGVCKGVGENKLGKILMQTRMQLKTFIKRNTP